MELVLKGSVELAPPHSGGAAHLTHYPFFQSVCAP